MLFTSHVLEECSAVYSVNTVRITFSSIKVLLRTEEMFTRTVLYNDCRQRALYRGSAVIAVNHVKSRELDLTQLSIPVIFFIFEIESGK